MKPVARIVPAVLLISTLTASSASAATILVPADEPTIQDGLDAANNGDTVLVAPDTYLENIDFLGKAITLRSEAGAEVTVIDGNQSGSAVRFVNEMTEISVLDGFTIRNGRAEEGAGIYCFNSSPLILNSTITRNDSTEDGGGIYCDLGSPMIRNCEITENDAHDDGGGVYCFNGGHATIINCEISRNNAAGSGSPSGGGVAASWSDLTILNCIITNNFADAAGGGIFYSTSGMTLTNCTFSKNTSSMGGAIKAENPTEYFTPGTILNCILWDDISSEGPEIWLAADTELIVTYSDVEGGKQGVEVRPGYELTWLENIDSNPIFVGEEDYHLSAGSPCVDSGDPDPSYNDICIPPSLGSERNDMGAYGGPGACDWTPCRDNDGDGYEEEACGGDDCDDSDPLTHPGADDPCDGVDQACDGLGEEVDSDVDGYMICEGDCDDDEPAVNPGIAELCDNGFDDDCDGYTDLDDPDCIVVFTLEMDASCQSGILRMDFAVGMESPATWTTFLILIYPTTQFLPLWSVSLPVIDPPVDWWISYPFFPNLGWIGIFSSLLTDDGLQTYVFGWVDTGRPS